MFSYQYFYFRFISFERMTAYEGDGGGGLDRTSTCAIEKFLSFHSHARAANCLV